MGIHVVALGPERADLSGRAPPVDDVRGEVRARCARRKDPVERHAAGSLQERGGVLEAVVQREPAVAHENLVRGRRAQNGDNVARVRAAAVLAKVRRRERNVGGLRPPDPARLLDGLPLVRDPHVGLGVVADVPVQPRLEVVAVGRFEPAVDVVVQIGRIVVVRQRVQAREVASRRRDVRPHVIVWHRLSGVRETARDAQLRDAVEVGPPVCQQLAEVAVPHGFRVGACQEGAGVHQLPLCFERHEEEQLVPAARITVA